MITPQNSQRSAMNMYANNICYMIDTTDMYANNVCYMIDTTDKLKQDKEIQSWASELAAANVQVLCC